MTDLAQLIASECGILPTRHWGSNLGTCSECPLPQGHLGPHHSISSRYGLIEWEDDYECGCCEPEDSDRCFWFRALQAQQETSEYDH